MSKIMVTLYIVVFVVLNYNYCYHELCNVIRFVMCKYLFKVNIDDLVPQMPNATIVS